MQETTSEQWERIKYIFDCVIDLSSKERADFLATACSNDDQLRYEIETLIAADKETASFIIDTNIVKFAKILKTSSTIFTSTAPNSLPSEENEQGFPVLNWNRYEFVKLVGEGGMGCVYKAKDLKLNRYVALKFLRSQNPEMIARFSREAQAQAGIEHDNVCKVYEVGEVAGQYYIAMQYIDGEPLKIAKNQTLEEKVQIIKDVAYALQQAHKLGLIHRDIKPANIILERQTRGWRPYVVDFGLVREIETNAQTKIGALLGTPAYMSPEQAMQAFGENILLDRRSDIYSLGVTFYELLGKQLPYQASTTIEILRKIVQVEPIPLRLLDRSIPVDLETIVMKCLEKDPSYRYESARALAEDLECYLAGEPIAAKRANFFYRAIKKFNKNRKLVVGSSFLFILLTILIGNNLQTRWTLNEQTRLSQQFGQEIEKIESIMRYAHLLPLHDITPESNLVREKINLISEQMKKIGHIGYGPGEYAIGCGYMALQDTETALVHLQNAWQSGYQTPDVKYALGKTLSAIYQKKLMEISRISDQNVRKIYLDEIYKEYREPALEYLRTANQSKWESSTYVEGLIALCEKRYQEALEKAEEASKEISWLYEAKKLEGDIYLSLGNTKQENGQYQDALLDYERAEKAYQTASELARSDVSIYEQNAEELLQTMSIKLKQGEDVTLLCQNIIAVCDRALKAYPQSTQAYNKKSRAYFLLASYQSIRGLDPLPTYTQSTLMVKEAIKIAFVNKDNYFQLGEIYVKQAQYLLNTGKDPQEAINNAIECYQKSVNEDPNYSLAYDGLGEAISKKAKYQMNSGIDPTKELELSIKIYKKAIELNPELISAHNDLAAAYTYKLINEITKGLDPKNSIGKAIESYKNAIKLDPSNWQVYSNLCATYINAADYELLKGEDVRPTVKNAIEIAEKAIKLNPNAATAYLACGQAYRAQGFYEMRHNIDPHTSFAQAIKNNEKSIEVNPRNSTTYDQQGRIYRLLAEYELALGLDAEPLLLKSIKLHQKGLEINPNSDLLYRDLAYSYSILACYLVEKKRSPSTAINNGWEAIEKALHINNNDYYTYFVKGQNALAEAYYQLGINKSPIIPLEKGISVLQKSLEINDKYTPTHILLAKLYYKQAEWLIKNKGNPEILIQSALDATEKALKINPKAADATVLQGALLLMKARLESKASSTKDMLAQKAKLLLEQSINNNSMLKREYLPVLNQTEEFINK